MYDFIIQLKRAFLQTILNELNETARPLLPDTLDEIPPLDISGVFFHPVLNIGDSELVVDMIPINNALEVQVNNTAIQIKAQNQMGIPEEEALFELSADLAIQLPIGAREENNRILVGTDLATLTEDNVQTLLLGEHPLADDQVLLELVNRFIQISFENGLIPTIMEIPTTPFPGTPFDLSGFINVVNDQGEGDLSRTVRVSPGNVPTSFDLTIPLEVWGLLSQPGLPGLNQQLRFTIDLIVTFPIIRQLINAPAFIDVLLANGTVATANYTVITGQAFIGNPIAAGFIDQLIVMEGQQ